MGRAALGHADRSNVYLEYGDKFDWLDLPPPTAGERAFATGCGIRLAYCATAPLSPAVLTMRATLLCNLFETTLEEIWETPRAKAIYQACSERQRNSAASVGMPAAFCNGLFQIEQDFFSVVLHIAAYVFASSE